MTTMSSTIEVTVTLRVCRLDTSTVRTLRAVLSDCAAGPSTHLVVDLREMDDRHEMTVYALLSEKARTTTLADGNMTAVGPSRRLSQLLVATGIPVARAPLAQHVSARREELSVGACAS